MMDNIEQLVHLYLRLNGFFTIANYLVHNPKEWTDVDVYGVRFPYKSESVEGDRLADDDSLQLSDAKIEVILAEIGRSKADFNDSWHKTERMKYVLDFLGFFDSDDQKRLASETLARLEAFENDRIRIRPFLFSGQIGMSAGPSCLPLADVLRFIENRFRKAERYKRYRPVWEGTLAGQICASIERTRLPLTLKDDIEGIRLCCRMG